MSELYMICCDTCGEPATHGVRDLIEIAPDAVQRVGQHTRKMSRMVSSKTYMPPGGFRYGCAAHPVTQRTFNLGDADYPGKQ